MAAETRQCLTFDLSAGIPVSQAVVVVVCLQSGAGLSPAPVPIAAVPDDPFDKSAFGPNDSDISNPVAREIRDQRLPAAMLC